MLWNEKIDEILRHPLFTGIDRDNALNIFESCNCDIRDYRDGAVIHSPEGGEKMLGLMLKGRAVVNTKDPSKNTLLRFLKIGDLFGCANLFIDQPYVSVISAVQASRVLILSEEAVRRLLESDRVFLYHYLAFLADRVCYLNRKIGYLTAGSAERRLALYLCSFEESEIKMTLSFSALSELLDIGRASLYRAFDCLSADGHIQKKGHTITIHNLDALKRAYQ